MTPTRCRDQVAELAKTNISKAIALAEKIDHPWFQAQAWSHVARHAAKPLPFARKAAKSAARGHDDYQKSAVRAWEIAALAERELNQQARRSLAEALEPAASVTPVSSRAESLLLLFQAAFKISKNDGRSCRGFASGVYIGPLAGKRARNNVGMMLNGELRPREFFW